MVIYYYGNEEDTSNFQTASKNTPSPELKMSVKKSHSSLQNSKKMGFTQLQVVQLPVESKELMTGQRVIPFAQSAQYSQLTETRLKGIVRVLCSAFEGGSADAPYAKIPASKKSSTGFFAKSDENYFVVTNAHAVRHCVEDSLGKRVVEIYDESSNNMDGKVVMENDYDDLAFIAVDSDKLTPKIKASAVPMDDFDGRLKDMTLPEPGTQLVVKGYSLGNPCANRCQGEITGFCGVPYALSGRVGVGLRFEGAIAPGNSGGPAYDFAGNLLGIVFEGSDQINFLIPADVLHLNFTRFKKMWNHPSKFVKMRVLDIGVDLQETNKADLSKLLGKQLESKSAQKPLDASQPANIGLRVKKDCKDLKEGDLITEMDGAPLTSEGYAIHVFNINGREYPYPVHFKALSVFATDENPTIRMKVIRDGAEMEIDHSCSAPKEIVPHFLCDSSNDYIAIFGHLIVRLTMNKVVGDLQNKTINMEEIKIMTEDNKSSDQDEALTFVVNQNGYKAADLMDRNNSRVTEINGIKVKNMLDALVAFNNRIRFDDGTEFITFKLGDELYSFEFDEDLFMRSNYKVGIPPQYYRCEAFDALHLGGNCVRFQPSFSPGEITCTSCNAKVVGVRIEGKSIVYNAENGQVETGESEKKLENVPADLQKVLPKDPGLLIRSGKSQRIVPGTIFTH